MTQYWESSARLSFHGYENIAAFVKQYERWEDDRMKQDNCYFPCENFDNTLYWITEPYQN